MKFFGDLGSCFYGGSATVTPATEISSCVSSNSNTKSSSYSTKTPGETCPNNCCGGRNHAAAAEGLKKAKSANASRNWKPKLQAISEDGVMMSDHHSSRAVTSDDRLSVKVKAKSKPRVPASTHGDDYWKSTSMWAIPAFSPTPFTF